jgi:hypothetical protein
MGDAGGMGGMDDAGDMGGMGGAPQAANEPDPPPGRTTGPAGPAAPSAPSPAAAMSANPVGPPPPAGPVLPLGEIWIADLARVVTVLDVEPTDHPKLARIAGLLGMAVPAPAPLTAEPQQPRPPAQLPPGSPTRRTTAALRPADHGQPPPQRQEPVPLLTPLRTEAPEPRVWAGPALARQGPDPAAGLPPYHSLLPPSSEAATLHLLLSRVVNEGPVDIERLLDLVASGYPLTELPRQPVRTLRFGVQVLVDLGEGMRPFLRDQMEVVERINAIAGRHGREVRYFTGSPLHRSGPGAGWTWKPYRPPANGTRVLVLSDFGQHSEPGELSLSRYRQDWQTTVGLIRRNGCLPVALMPVPQDGWPRWLTALMPVLSWDRTTTAAITQARLS